MKNEVINLLNEINDMNLNLKDIQSQLQIKRNNIEEKLKIIYKEFFRNIIKESGYELTIKEYIDKWDLRKYCLVVKGINIFKCQDTFNSDTPCFEIWFVFNGKAEESSARIITQLASERYWEWEMYKSKEFEINLNNMEELRQEILNEIDLLMEANNKRLFHEKYSSWELAKYRNLEVNFELYKKCV